MSTSKKKKEGALSDRAAERGEQEGNADNTTDMYSCGDSPRLAALLLFGGSSRIITIMWRFIDPGGEILFSLKDLQRKVRARVQLQYREAPWGSQ